MYYISSESASECTVLHFLLKPLVGRRKVVYPRRRRRGHRVRANGTPARRAGALPRSARGRAQRAGCTRWTRGGREGTASPL